MKTACGLGIALALWVTTERAEALGVSWNVTTQVEKQASESRAQLTRRPVRALILLDCSADEALCSDLIQAIHEHITGQVVRQAPWGTLENMDPPPPEAMALRLEYVDIDGQASAFLTMSRGKGTIEQSTSPIARTAFDDYGVSISRQLVRDLRSILTQTPG